MTTAITPGDHLRSLLAGPDSVLLPGLWDPLSALVARRAGFRAGFLSGYCLSGTLLGQPDVGLLTQTEVADAARRVCSRVPDMAVIVDADTGYGNALNTRRTVEQWEQAGAAGMFLEDQVWPKRCGHMAGKQVIEPNDWLAKLRAAVDRRTDLHITARTDARSVHGLAAAIERGKMARDAGVDAVFVEAPETIEELQQIAIEIPDTTLVANMVEHGRTPLLTPEELGQIGFRLVVSPLSGLLAMMHGLGEAMTRLANTGSMRDHLDDLIGFDDFTDLVGLPEQRSVEDRFG